MSPFSYRRTHIPTGKTDIRGFDLDYCIFASRKGITDYYKHKQECIDKTTMWNKMGIVYGKQMWLYEFVEAPEKFYIRCME